MKFLFKKKYLLIISILFVLFALGFIYSQKFNAATIQTPVNVNLTFVDSSTKQPISQARITISNNTFNAGAINTMGRSYSAQTASDGKIILTLPSVAYSNIEIDAVNIGYKKMIGTISWKEGTNQSIIALSKGAESVVVHFQSLASGWNMVSFPFTPSNSSPDIFQTYVYENGQYVSKTLENNYFQAYAYENGQYSVKKISTEFPSQIKSNLGYWLYAKKATILPFFYESTDYNEVAPTILSKGWNLIAFRQNTNININELQFIKNGEIKTFAEAASLEWINSNFVYYNNSSSSYEKFGLNFVSVIGIAKNTLFPGRSYWLYSNEVDQILVSAPSNKYSTQALTLSGTIKDRRNNPMVHKTQLPIKMVNMYFMV